MCVWSQRRLVTRMKPTIVDKSSVICVRDGLLLTLFFIQHGEADITFGTG